MFKPSETQETQQLSRLNRYETTLERSFYRNMKELRDLQAERADQEPEVTTDSTDLQNEATDAETPSHVLLVATCYDRSAHGASPPIIAR